MPESVPPNPWYSASPEANTTTCRPTRHRVRASAASSRAFAPMIRVKRASTGHAASSAREPYTRPPVRSAQRFGVLRKADAARHDVNAPSFRIHSVAVHSLQSFLPSRKYVRPIVPLYSGSACSPLLAVGASGEEAEAWEGSLCPEKFFRFSPVPFAHPVFPQIKIALKIEDEQPQHDVFPATAGKLPEGGAGEAS